MLNTGLPRFLSSSEFPCSRSKSKIVNRVQMSDALDEDKRILYTAIYAAAHSFIVIPFLFFWNVENSVKLRSAAIAFPVLVLWIALLGGWLRFG